jgi:hypothetical protein
LSTVHLILAWVVAVSTGITGAWATAGHWRTEIRSPILIPAIYLTWVLTVIEVTVGVAVLQSGREADDLHYFYGFLAMASIAIIYSYRQQIAQWEYLLLGGGNLFIMGLALRAFFL